MKIRWKRFNIYLALGLALGLIAGCRSPESKKQHALTTMRFYLEVNSSPATPSQLAEVLRDNTVWLRIAQRPFLGDGNIASAEVLHDLGGFSLKIQFDRDGTFLLEQTSAAYRGQHFAVWCQWAEAPDWKLNQGRFVAAPVFAKHIQDGALVFTPDTSEEEAKQIVTGLNNVAKETQGRYAW
jgi:hypothetical protein